MNYIKETSPLIYFFGSLNPQGCVNMIISLSLLFLLIIQV